MTDRVKIVTDKYDLPGEVWNGLEGTVNGTENNYFGVPVTMVTVDGQDDPPLLPGMFQTRGWSFMPGEVEFLD